MKKEKVTNHESTIKKAKEPSKLVLSRKLPKKYQISDSCVILITRESCNSLIRMVPLKTQKSKIRLSAFFSLTKPYNICSTGRDSSSLASQFWTLFPIAFSICPCFVVTNHFVEVLYCLVMPRKMLLNSDCSFSPTVL